MIKTFPEGVCVGGGGGVGGGGRQAFCPALLYHHQESLLLIQNLKYMRPLNQTSFEM